MKVCVIPVLNAMLVSLLMGCGSTPVASDVSQREANRIVAILHKSGISAHLHAARVGKGRYVVEVSDAAFPNAATILSNRGLPGEKQPSFEEMTASNGIIPTSREVDNLRLDRALAAELEDLFSMNSSVRNVGAIVRMHSVRSLRDASIIVALELEPRSNVSLEESKELVRKAFPTIDSNRIYVTASHFSLESHGNDAGKEMVPFFLLGNIPSALYAKLAPLILGVVLFSGMVFGATGYLIGQYLSIRRNGALRSLGRSASKTIQQRTGLEVLDDDDQAEADT